MLQKKSSVDEIRQRFDNDVDRFSNIETGPVQSLMWNRYGEYLRSVGGESYRDKVFDYIDKEDSPRPVTYQMDLLRKVGFKHVELLHKNSCFAAFGAIKK